MKKILSILIAGAMIFSMAACGENSAPIDGPNTEPKNNAETMTLIYGTDEKEITIYRPDGASFSSLDQDGTTIISLAEDNYEWLMDVWGESTYQDEAGTPLVFYYYNGKLDDFTEDGYESYTQEVRDLGFEFNGQPVKRIESTYLEVGDDEEETDIFIGIEFEDTRNGEHYGNGLLGFELSMYDEVPSDEEYIELFKEVFGMNK